jgi:hypothetical protein
LQYLGAFRSIINQQGKEYEEGRGSGRFDNDNHEEVPCVCNHEENEGRGLEVVANIVEEIVKEVAEELNVYYMEKQGRIKTNKERNRM